MGALATKANLYAAIEAGDELVVKQILSGNPGILNEPITSDGRSNAIWRAAYLGKLQIVELLISLGADVNQTGDSKVTALMWAASRGHVDVIDALHEAGCSLDKQDPEGLTAADYAALYGYYNALYTLHIKLCPVTCSVIQLQEIRDRGNRKISYVDYACILMTLESGIPPENAPYFTVPPTVHHEELQDPVDDPLEPWRDWTKRIIDFNFDSGPKVERSVLPDQLQPQNRIIGQLKSCLGLDQPIPPANTANESAYMSHADVNEVIAEIDDIPL